MAVTNGVPSSTSRRSTRLDDIPEFTSRSARISRYSSAARAVRQGRREVRELVPAREAVDILPPVDELTVPGLYLGRGPQTGVGDACDGPGTVVHQAESPQVAEDAELVLGGDCEAHVRSEVLLQPGPEVRGHGLGVPVVGDEVDFDPLPLQPAQDLGRAGVGLAFADAARREGAFVDLHRRRLAVSVEHVGPGGDGLRVQPLTGHVEHGLADPRGEVPYSRVHVTGYRRAQPINSSTGIASVR